MANKINVKLILELLQTPMSQREIIETRHISSKSITAVCRRAAELGVSYADLVDKSDDEVYLLFFPDNLDSRKHDDAIVEKNAVNAENSLF